jgi:CPA1 family monovalent cation:H+ antiporter
MTTVDIAAILLGVAALFAWLNHRTLRLPAEIAMVLAGLLGAIALSILDGLFPRFGMSRSVNLLLENVDFSNLLMNGMLGFLLFAGSLTVDLQELKANLGTVLTLATGSVAISTVLIGAGTYWLLHAGGVEIAFVYCLVFGALISPTDPVAVLALLRELHVPPKMRIVFTGESLLNDGVGVVAFTVLLTFASAHSVSFGSVVAVLLREAGGGILLGLAGGLVVFYGARKVNEPNVEVQLSVALVAALMAIAAHTAVSGPLACVVAGIFIGNPARKHAMQDPTTAALDRIWSFAGYLMNTVLFLLLGLQAAVFEPATLRHAVGLLGMVALVIVARFISIAVPMSIFRRLQEVPRGMIRILTWGGLRGGISVALALSLPPFHGRAAIHNVTYVVVVFTIIVQGLTTGPYLRRFVDSGD